jgi:small conductance mechanosensitive channel
VLGIILNTIVSKVVDRITNKGNNGKDKRKLTIINLCKSIFKYFILVFVVLGILKIYGVDTTSIIASLGVFAAVIGLAFQDILKDFLAGVTIIFDNNLGQKVVGIVSDMNMEKGYIKVYTNNEYKYYNFKPFYRHKTV